MMGGEHRRIDPRRPLYALLAALALIAGAFLFSTSSAPTAVSEAAPLSVAEECAKALGYPARTSADRTWLRTCVHALTPPTATPSPSGSPTSTPPPTTTAAPTTTPPVTTTAPPTTTPPPTTVPPTTAPPGQLGCAPFPAFPDASCTGWQHTGVTLHPCGDPAGSATHLETPGAVYDGCSFADSIVIQAANITVKRSWVHGVVRTALRDAKDQPDYRGAQLVDVEVGPSGDPDFAGISNGTSLSCLRCHIHNTASGIHIGDNNLIVDSYVHTLLDTGAHGAGAGTGQGMGDDSIIVHNNLDCSRDTGAAHCSSALSLYDEPTLNNVLVQNNLFNSVSGYGMYGGGPQGTNIRILDNVFGQKYYPTCGLFGPVAAYYAGNAGNQWSGNRYQDGSVVAPSSNT